MSRLLLFSLAAMLLASATVRAETGLALGVLGHGAVGNLGDRDDGRDWSGGGGASLGLELPVMKSFHVSPAVTFSGVGGALSTETAVLFKFVLPLPTVALFLGLGPCLETRHDRLNAGLVAAGGFWTHLVGSLALVVQTRFAEYRGDGYRETAQLGAGLLLFF